MFPAIPVANKPSNQSSSSTSTVAAVSSVVTLPHIIEKNGLNKAKQEFFLRILHANNPDNQQDAKTLMAAKEKGSLPKNKNIPHRVSTFLNKKEAKEVLLAYQAGNNTGLAAILVTSAIWGNVDLQLKDFLVYEQSDSEWIYTLVQCRRVLAENAMQVTDEYKVAASRIKLGINAATFKDLPLACWSTSQDDKVNDAYSAQRLPFQSVNWLDSRVNGYIRWSERFPANADEEENFRSEKLYTMLLNALRPLSLYETHAERATFDETTRLELKRLCREFTERYFNCVLKTSQEFQKYFHEQYQKYKLYIATNTIPGHNIDNVANVGVIPKIIKQLEREAITLGKIREEGVIRRRLEFLSSNLPEKLGGIGTIFNFLKELNTQAASVNASMKKASLVKKKEGAIVFATTPSSLTSQPRLMASSVVSLESKPLAVFKPSYTLGPVKFKRAGPIDLSPKMTVVSSEISAIPVVSASDSTQPVTMSK